MQRISDELDHYSNSAGAESIDSDRFRSINQIFSQIKNGPGLGQIKQNQSRSLLATTQGSKHLHHPIGNYQGVATITKTRFKVSTNPRPS